MEFFNDIGSDPLKPSLFELVAQEQLKDLLQPALKYVLSVRLQFILAPPESSNDGRNRCLLNDILDISSA